MASRGVAICEFIYYFNLPRILFLRTCPSFHFWWPLELPVKRHTSKLRGGSLIKKEDGQNRNIYEDLGREELFLFSCMTTYKKHDLGIASDWVLFQKKSRRRGWRCGSSTTVQTPIPPQKQKQKKS
jgi:hypothetical protein